MDRSKLEIIILKALKKSDENDNQSEFWDYIGDLKCSELKIGETINCLEDKGMISGSRQSIDAKREHCLFVEPINITSKGERYLKENSKLKKMSKIAVNVVKGIKDLI